MVMRDEDAVQLGDGVDERGRLRERRREDPELEDRRHEIARVPRALPERRATSGFGKRASSRRPALGMSRRMAARTSFHDCANQVRRTMRYASPPAAVTSVRWTSTGALAPLSTSVPASAFSRPWVPVSVLATVAV